MSAKINIKDKIISLKNDIQKAYEIYKEGEFVEFEEHMTRIKYKINIYAGTVEDDIKEIRIAKKDDKFKDIELKLKEKDIILNDLLKKKTNIQDIENKYKKEYEKEIEKFKESYNINDNREYIMLKEELDQMRSNAELYNSIKNENEILKKEIESIKIKEKKKDIRFKSDKEIIDEDYGVPIYLFENRFNDSRKKCSEKTQYDIKFYYDLYLKCKKDKY